MPDAVSGDERAVRRAFWIIYVDWMSLGLTWSDVEDLSAWSNGCSPGSVRGRIDMAVPDPGSSTGLSIRSNSQDLWMKIF
jgi:hypothetical protein